MLTVRVLGNNLPHKAHEDDACFDLVSVEDVTLSSAETRGCIRAINTGLRFEIPRGWYGQIYSRSGLALRGVTAEGGVIDSCYRGEIKVILYNHNSTPFSVEKGQRIAQIAFHAVPHVTMESVSTLSETERAEGGFGSTG